MTLAGRLRQQRMWPELLRRQDMYASSITAKERRAWQLEEFNRQWRRITGTVPHYTAMEQEHSLPDAFRSWEEFVDCVPVTTRALVRVRRAEMTSQERPPQWWRITGGSTGQPTHLSAWHSEARVTGPDQWLGRLWRRVIPSDRLFPLWGHRHVMGFGIKGWINRRKREPMDWMLSYSRFLPYSMGEAKMRRAGEALLRARPGYVYGYSVVLDAFARASGDRAHR